MAFWCSRGRIPADPMGANEDNNDPQSTDWAQDNEPASLPARTCPTRPLTMNFERFLMTQMTDWEAFWNEYPTKVADQDLFAQVAHTVGGKAYSPEQFQQMIDTIRAGLELGKRDRLLDVCCGNGMVTKELSVHCDEIHAVDFSNPLIDVARRHNGKDNIFYYAMNALNLDSSVLESLAPFDRILMYTALQHFRFDQFPVLIDSFLNYTSKSFVIFVGGVLDAERRYSFYNAEEDQESREAYRRQNQDRLGTWWEKDMIREICNGRDLSCEIDHESPGRPGAHYRFDVKIYSS